MARTYLEKFYFPIHVRYVEGDFYGKELTNEEVIECLPCIQNQIDVIQLNGVPQNDLAKRLNGVIDASKIMSVTWGVTHRYGVPYGIVMVRCAEPIDTHERNDIRLEIGFINEDGFWSEFKYREIEFGEKIIAVRLFDNDDGDYFVHTQSLMYMKWKRKKKSKKWRDE